MTIGGGTLRGPAGVFAAADRALFADAAGNRLAPSFLSVANFSYEFWIRFTAFHTTGQGGRILRIGHPVNSGSGDVSLDLRARNNVEGVAPIPNPQPVLGATKTVGGVTQFWHGLNTEAAATLLLNTDYHVFFVFPSGQNPLFYLNGAPYLAGPSETGSNTTAPPAGAIPVPAAYELTIGDPGPGALSGFTGILGRVFVWPFVTSAAWVAASYRLQQLSGAAAIHQEQAVGISAEYPVGAANRAPVAIPLRGTTPVDSFLDTNVATRAFDPEGAALTASIPADDPPSAGTSSLQGTQTVRYTPAGGTANQVHRVPFAVDDLTPARPVASRSRSVITVAVTPGSGVAPELPAEIPGRVVTVNNGNGLRNAFANGSTLGTLRAGDTIILASGSYDGTSTIATGVGTRALPIVIKAAAVNGPNFNLARLNLNGNNIIAHGLRFTGRFALNTAAVMNVGGNGVAVMRCDFDGVTNFSTGDEAQTTTAVQIQGNDVSFLFCEQNALEGWGFRFSNDTANPALRGTLHRCWLHDTVDDPVNNGREPLQFGQTGGANNVRSNVVLNGLAYESLWQNTQLDAGDNECISIKSSGNSVIRCRMISGKTFTIRHGFDNNIHGCRLTGGQARLIVFGSRGSLANTICTRIDLNAGLHYQEDGPTTANKASARSTTISGCNALLNVGIVVDTPTVDALNNIIRGHTGSIVTEKDYAFETSRNSAFRETGTTNPGGALTGLPATIGATALTGGTSAADPGTVGIFAPWVPPTRGPRSAGFA